MEHLKPLTNEDKDQVMSGTSKVLPLKPTDEGWTAEQIREKGFQGIDRLFDLLKNAISQTILDLDYNASNIDEAILSINDISSQLSEQIDSLSNTVVENKEELLENIRSNIAVVNRDIARLNERIDNIRITGDYATKEYVNVEDQKLQEQINNLKSRGRFLSDWNSLTGLATTVPTVSPYPYRAGDYFVIGVINSRTVANYEELTTLSDLGNGEIVKVSSDETRFEQVSYYKYVVVEGSDDLVYLGNKLYRPSGTEYNEDVPSTEEETAEVGFGDTYMYDGTYWILQSNTSKTVNVENVSGLTEKLSEFAKLDQANTFTQTQTFNENVIVGERKGLFDQYFTGLKIRNNNVYIVGRNTEQIFWTGTFLAPTSGSYNFDLGSNNSRWRSLYLKEGINLYSNDLKWTINSKSSNAGLEFKVNDSLMFTLFSSGFVPSTNNTRDLGSSACKWRNLYLSGNIISGSNNIMADYIGTKVFVHVYELDLTETASTTIEARLEFPMLNGREDILIEIMPQDNLDEWIEKNVSFTATEYFRDITFTADSTLSSVVHVLVKCQVKESV